MTTQTTTNPELAEKYHRLAHESTKHIAALKLCREWFRQCEYLDENQSQEIDTVIDSVKQVAMDMEANAFDEGWGSELDEK